MANFINQSELCRKSTVLRRLHPRERIPIHHVVLSIILSRIVLLIIPGRNVENFSPRHLEGSVSFFLFYHCSLGLLLSSVVVVGELEFFYAYPPYRVL